MNPSSSEWGNACLDLWDLGMRSDEIVAQIGGSGQRVSRVIASARDRGDPRAQRRRGRGIPLQPRRLAPAKAPTHPLLCPELGIESVTFERQAISENGMPVKIPISLARVKFMERAA